MNRLLTADLERDIEHRIMHGTTYRGVPAFKMPMDAWVYQEIIAEQRPDFVVEIGNRNGGAMLYLADLCALVGHGRVVGVDIHHEHLDPAIEMFVNEGWMDIVTADALEARLVVGTLVGNGSCLVIEDSAHTYKHTLAVLRLYSQLVRPGGYLICEDGVMAPVAKAIKAFLAEREDFVADRSREWPLTWNPSGYLRRVA